MDLEAPLFSIVTVSFDSEKTIKETITSLLNQSYTNFEYIIIDGNSKDNTVEIIKEFEKKFKEKRITYKWVSEQDNGIYDAINKGISFSSGELIGIINSDDWYELDALHNIKEQYDISKADLIHGNINFFTPEKRFIKTLKAGEKNQIKRKMPFFHPTSFIRKKVYEKLDGYSLEYKICSDYDFIIKIIKNNFNIGYVDKVIANFRIGGVSTTQVKNALKESHLIRVNNGYNRFWSKFNYYLETLICKIKY